MHVVERGFGILNLRQSGGPENTAAFGTFTVSDAAIAAGVPLSAGLRCLPLPPQAFVGAVPAAIDAAPTAIEWQGYLPATESGSGLTLYAVGVGVPSGFQNGQNATPALLGGTTLPEFAVLSPSSGDPPEWFPGLWTRESRWRITSGTGLRVYCDAHGTVRALPRDESAAAFVVANAPGEDLAPYNRALRAEFRGPVGGVLTRVLRPMFGVGGESFEGMAEFVALPGGAAGLGWKLTNELVSTSSWEIVQSGLYLVENVIDHAATRHPTTGAAMSLLYLDRSNPPGPAFYELDAPMAGWRAGELVATRQRVVS